MAVAPDPFLPLMKAGVKPGLERIRAILRELDHPEQQYRSILVAGSNGKGTTCAVLESILRHSGFRTGMFTSPHLVSVTERFRVNGAPVAVSTLRQFMREQRRILTRIGATYFEATTACALWIFARRKVDWAVLEIGLGGRWDACNAVDAELSVITSIAREHTEYLGKTLAKIAAEKAQIARRGRLLVVGEVSASAHARIAKSARTIGAEPIWMGRDFKVGRTTLSSGGSHFTLRRHGRSLPLRTALLGRNAAVNSTLAAAALSEFAEWEEMEWPQLQAVVQEGVHEAYWPARLQVVGKRPLVVVDVAHNAAAFAALARDWKAIWPRSKPVVVVGLLQDKAASQIGKTLAGFAGPVIATTPDSPRGVSADELARQWRRIVPCRAAIPDIGIAVRTAIGEAGKGGSVLICGSHFVAGPALKALQIAV